MEATKIKECDILKTLASCDPLMEQPSSLNRQPRLCACGGEICYVTGHPFGFWPQRCPKCDAKFSSEHLRRERIDRAHRLRERLAFMPPRYRAARLSHIPGKLAASLLAGPCYLWGGVGCGKTHAIYALARHLAIRQGGGVFTTFEKILQKIRAGFDDGRSESSIMYAYERASVLFIDDLAAGTDSGFAARVLLAVLDYRNNYLLPTYFTSNVPPETIKNVYGERVFSRLVGACNVIRLGGKDRRLQNG